MTDPERLTRWPEHPYRLLHASSYDRLSVQPNTPAWFANTDWSKFIRTETVDGRTEYVLLEADGPGSIVRFWATVRGSGNTLRIYVDNAPSPVVEGTLTQIVGRNALAEPTLSFLAPYSADTATGHNLYLPVPFKQHCKVTVSSPSTRLYYNIDYRVYDVGAEVESFSTNALNVYRTEYLRAQSALAAGHPMGVGTSAVSHITGRLNWGGGAQFVTLEGPAAIRFLRLKLSAADLPQALRSTHLEIDFDGERRAVSCPVGDFFGAGCSVTTGSTWFVEASGDGVLRAFWTMPFRNHATVRLVNYGQQRVEVVQGEVGTGPYAWDELRSLHFHAAWRDYAFEDTVEWSATKGGEDLNYVTLHGQGRFVGDTLSIFNDASTVPNSYLNWWGEGDEKITVDGEAFPSHFGTGTEDYYGYAWCLPQVYNTPFIAQPLGSGNYRKGQTINTRLRLLDDLPYRSSLCFDMEFLAWKTGKHRFAPTVFWYARPGGVCDTPDPVAKSLLPVPRTTSGIESAPLVCPISVRREFEAMTVAQNSGGAVSCVTSNGLGLSGEQCVRWPYSAAGGRLEFVFSASFTGRCALALHALRGPASGTLRVSVNGRVATNGVSLYATSVAPVTLDLGVHRLLGGDNTLIFEVTDIPFGSGQAAFAFDYLQNEGPYYVSRALPVLRERLEGECLPGAVSCGELAPCAGTNLLSGGSYACWSGAAVGGEASFKVVTPEPRQVPLTGVFVGATNGAVCDIYVNGSPACLGVDLRRSEWANTNVFLGEQLLAAGTNIVTVRLVGCAAGADPSALTFGLDSIDIGSLYARYAERQIESPLLGPSQDADGDGLINLAEYAFGGDPNQVDGSELWPSPEILREGDAAYPVISYRRRKAVYGLDVVGSEGLDLQVDGIIYQVQSASVLDAETDWATTNAYGRMVQCVGAPDDDNGKTVRVRVRTVDPLGRGNSIMRFMRVGLREP